jgi:superfamily II DNA/RNA helicase
LAIPEIVGGKNVLCAAETGSGKTVAYLAPIISGLRQEEADVGLLRLARRPRALVLVPSRELVAQVVVRRCVGGFDISGYGEIVVACGKVSRRRHL